MKTDIYQLGQFHNWDTKAIADVANIANYENHYYEETVAVAALSIAYYLEEYNNWWNKVSKNYTLS